MDDKKKVEIMNILEAFKSFVQDSIDEGMGDDTDSMAFIEACMEVFLETLDEGKEFYV